MLELQLHAYSAVYGHKPQSFLPNRSPKMRESQQLFFGLRLMSRIIEEFQRPVIKTEVVQHFGRFFSSNENAPANRKKGFYRSRLPKNEEIGGILVFSGSELELF
jgi:hypothetical protein